MFWGLELYELVLGLAVFPLVAVDTANVVLIVVLFAVSYTAGAAALFYGASLLVAAVWGQPHCEATVVSNLILRRDDQLGCPTFTPIDAMEARRAH